MLVDLLRVEDYYYTLIDTANADQNLACTNFTKFFNLKDYKSSLCSSFEKKTTGTSSRVPAEFITSLSPPRLTV